MDDTHRMLSALPYVLWPIAVILLIVQETKEQKQQDKLLRHHAYNALGFALVALLLSVPVLLLSIIPLFGHVLATLYWITIVVLAVIYALRAYNGQKVVIPYVTDFLKRNVKGF